MSYVEKITTMRRVALITPPDTGGLIQYEGVNIEGDVILRETYALDKIATIKESHVDDFARKRGLVVVYQDSKDEEAWEPRA